MLAYFHGPIMVLMTANFVFFVLTAKNLLQTEKDTRMAGRQKKGTERWVLFSGFPVETIFKVRCVYFFFVSYFCK